jgi:Domain of unknown function (DUF4919)
MKLIIAAFFLMIPFLAKSQTDFKKVDRAIVEKEVKDTGADTFYPKLLNRFNSFDSTLTNEGYRLLYYGFVFQENYAGDADEKKTEIRKALKNNDYDLAIKMCDTVLEHYPVSLSANYNRALGLYFKNKENLVYKNYGDRYKKLLDAIVSSGDGLTCETSFRTICISDEYEIMYNYFQIEKNSGQSLLYPCDKLSVTPSQYFKEKDMYFDTSESMMFMDNLLKEDKDKKKKN